MKTGKLKSKLKTSVLYSSCWKLRDRTQSFVFCSQIVAAEYINAMFLLVSKFKMNVERCVRSGPKQVLKTRSKGV